MTPGRSVSNFGKNDNLSETLSNIDSGEHKKKTESQKHNEIAGVPIFDPREEEVLFIAYRMKKIRCAEIQKNWYGPNSPSYQEVLDIVTRFNIDNNPYARYENGSLVWIGDRWSE